MSLLEQSTYEVQSALEQWDDHRVMHADDIEDLVLFWRYVPNVLSQTGKKFRGYQVRQRDGSWLMTVKVTEGSTPLVVFLTSGTPTGCVRLFVSQLDDERLVWHRDKYPWN